MKTKLYLINGPLGAGKTTFLKELLKRKAFTSARVIENEFASTSIDTDQLHEHQSEVQTIAGVCICCSTGDELTDALTSLAETNNEPVIIEATGVANSLKLIEKIVVADLLETYTVDHAFFVLDAAEASHDPQLLTQHKDELCAADSVLLSKIDLITESEAGSLISTLKELGAKNVHAAREGIVTPFVELNGSGILDYFVNLDGLPANHDADTNFTIINTSSLSFFEDSIQAIWKNLSAKFELKRMKGTVFNREGMPLHIEATPLQCRITQESSSEGKLVFIGAKAREITLQTLEQELHHYE